MNVEYCYHDIMAATMNVYWDQIRIHDSRKYLLITSWNNWTQITRVVKIAELEWFYLRHE